jgi:hypothetical protein
MLPVDVSVCAFLTNATIAPNLSWSVQKCGVFELAVVMVAREARLLGKM